MVLRTKNDLQTLLHYVASINRDYMYLFGIMYMCIAAVFSTILVSLLTEKIHTLKHYSSKAQFVGDMHTVLTLHHASYWWISWGTHDGKLYQRLQSHSMLCTEILSEWHFQLETHHMPSTKKFTPTKWLLVIIDLLPTNNIITLYLTHRQKPMKTVGMSIFKSENPVFDVISSQSHNNNLAS